MTLSESHDTVVERVMGGMASSGVLLDLADCWGCSVMRIATASAGLAVPAGTWREPSLHI